MSRKGGRTYGGGKQATYSGGVSVCIPWENECFGAAQVTFPAILEQEPEEFILGLNQPVLEEADVWLHSLVAKYPKTKIVGIDTEAHQSSVNRCVDYATGRYLLIQHPTILHLGQLIPALICSSSDPSDCVAFPRIIRTTLLKAAFLSPYQRHRLGTQYRGEPWTQSDVGTELGNTAQVLIGRENPAPHFWCGVLKKDLWRKLGGYKVNSLYSCADAEMVMSLLTHGVKIKGSGRLIALCIQEGV